MRIMCFFSDLEQPREQAHISVNSQYVCVHPRTPMCAGECEHLVLIHLIFTVVGISFQLLSQFESSEEAGNC